MRIIAGELKGKKLVSFPGKSIRPTSDRVREAIFNICASNIPGAAVLDLYAGTGAFAIEALSRGAASAVLIDVSAQAVSLIRQNIVSCRLQDQAVVICWDILKNLNCLKKFQRWFDLVFLDPPYQTHAIAPTLKHLVACGALKDQALIVVEHSVHARIPEDMAEFGLHDRRQYGKTLVSFLTYMLKKS